MKVKYLGILATGLIAASLAATPAADKKKKEEEKKPAAPVVDSSQFKKPSASKTKKYSDVITKEAVTSKGVFTTHVVGEKIYFEIPKANLGKEFLLVTRIAETPGIAYGGTEVGEAVLRWDKAYGKILLRSVAYDNVASDSLPIAKAVKLSNMEPVVAAFDIATTNGEGDSANVVIDVTELYMSDVAPFGIPSEFKTQYQIMGVDRKRSFIDHVKAYPKNVEVKTLLTFSSRKPAQQGNTQTISVKMHNSMVLLPEKPMRPRVNDNRVGYFSVEMNEFGETHQVDGKSYISRWRLEVKPEDVAKYKRGELVEPVQPIIYYIDPATPEKWRSALKKGVEDWNVAFEAAGFKNAIQCKMPPTKEEDPDWSAEDARYSVIRYFASDIKNAYGPHVSDPRTGEILESDIGWYHNVMNLLRNWYFVQAAPNDPRARQLPFPDSLMAELIRFVSSHEVGHTLGLQHNMKASHMYPTDSLRSAAFTKKYGTAPSIMDYARFNYVAQPGDNAALFPKIGPYDIHAIKWAYQAFPDAKSEEEEQKILDAYLKDALKDSLKHFGRQQFRITDPYAQTEDLGSDAIKSTAYGIKNLERVMSYLLDATKGAEDDYSLLREMYGEVLGQWYREMAHVANYVGGVETIERQSDDAGLEYFPLSADKQRAAIRFVGENGFKTPMFLLNKEVLRRIEASGSTDRIMAYQAALLNTMLATDKLMRISDGEALGSTWKLADAMGEIYKQVFASLESAAPSLNVYQRQLQREYVSNLENKLTGKNEVRAMSISQLNRILRAARAAQATATDAATKAHCEDLIHRITRILEAQPQAPANPLLMMGR